MIYIHGCSHGERKINNANGPVHRYYSSDYGVSDSVSGMICTRGRKNSRIIARSRGREYVRTADNRQNSLFRYYRGDSDRSSGVEATDCVSRFEFTFNGIGLGWRRATVTAFL